MLDDKESIFEERKDFKICSESFGGETSEESMDVLDFHFIELNKNGKTSKFRYKSLAKVSYVIQACFPRKEEKDVLMKEIGEIRISRES